MGAMPSDYGKLPGPIGQNDILLMDETMAFFSRFFASPERAKLPSLEEILAARQLPGDLPGLAEQAEEFPHLNGPEREQWGDAIRSLVDHGQPLPPLWLDAQYDLSPRLVPAWLAERDSQNGVFSRPFLDGLSLRMVAAGQIMPAAWLTMWGVTWEDVLERSLDQLREHSKDHPLQRLPSGIYRGAFGDDLASTRLLLPELWSGLFPGQNTFVALPAQDELFIAPQVLLPQLVEAITRTLETTTSRIMATIYQQVDESFLPANLQDPHPIAQPQRELRQSDQLEAYRAQAEALPAELGDAALPGLLKTQQGRSISFTTWTEGRPVLLPDTDLVGFVAASGKPLGIYFRQTLPRIAELHGTLLDFWGPRRLRYEGFPTAAQLARLECFATGEQMAELFHAAAPQARTSAAQRPEPSAPPLAGASSPVPAHLRGLSLGVQDHQ